MIQLKLFNNNIIQYFKYNKAFPLNNNIGKSKYVLFPFILECQKTMDRHSSEATPVEGVAFPTQRSIPIHHALSEPEQLTDGNHKSSSLK